MKKYFIYTLRRDSLIQYDGFRLRILAWTIVYCTNLSCGIHPDSGTHTTEYSYSFATIIFIEISLQCIALHCNYDKYERDYC